MAMYLGFWIPYIHVLLYGFFGVGKDTLAAQFPGDRLVLFLDGPGNDMPYMVGAKKVGELEKFELGTDPWGEPITITYRDIVAADDTLTRIEYYSSEAADTPVISSVLEMRLGMFSEEQDDWETLILSSMSAVNLEAMYMEQYVKNPLTKQGNEDPRQWRGGAADFLERIIFTQRNFMKCHVVYIAHTGEKDDGVTGEVLRRIALPGRLATQAGNFFSEVWRLYVSTDAESGIRQRWLQLDPDGRYQAKSHLNAPFPCEPTWDAIWSNWIKQSTVMQPTPTKEESSGG